MKKLNLKKYLLSIVGLFVVTNAMAQTVEAPKLTVHNLADGSIIHGLSDNGQWAVSYGMAASNASIYTNCHRINTVTGVANTLTYESEETPLKQSTANDVTDDGVVVGTYQSMPAYWTEDKGWTKLDLPLGDYNSGDLFAVTPDGKYAVGRTKVDEGYVEDYLLYDLASGELLDAPGVPTKGSAGEDIQQIRFTAISADGRYIAGIVDFSYMNNISSFIYDRKTKSYITLGFNSDGTPWMENIMFSDLDMGGTFSPNGKWFTATVHLYDETNGDYIYPFRYDMETAEVQVYDNLKDYAFVSVDNDGTIYTSQIGSSPVRNLTVLVNGFSYALDDLLDLRYGYDFYSKSNCENTGCTYAVSGDGKTIAPYVDTEKSYVLKMNESFAEAALKVNILKKYTATPADGSTLSKLNEVRLIFNYDITVLGTKDDIKLCDENGTAVGRIVNFENLSGEKRVARIGFRSSQTVLEEGKTYTLTIPAGKIAVSDDPTRTNEEITLHYNGRAAKPVELMSVTPASGTALSHLNVSTSPILLTFDTDVALADNALAYLYREGDTEPMDDIMLATSSIASESKNVLAFPVSTQYLFLENKYKVVISAGAITDINGENGNSEITLNYEGTYERVIESDDDNIYSEDFSFGLQNMLLRDGDRLTPTDEMKAIDFTAAGDSYAWVPVLDNEYSSNYAAASNSSYNPAGNADDWMMTPQIYIPNAKCRLDFDAQGYLKSKSDRLKVILYADDTVHNYLDSDLCNLILANGEVIMDEVLSPGDSEGGIDNDWTTYSFKLDKYAGKNIYIAFVNQNNDQSLVIVDNINVIHDIPFLTALTTETTVVGQASTTISGRITGNSATETFNSITVKLLDANKNVIDEKTESGLSISKDTKYNFTFSKPLPLTVGKEVPFYISVTMGSHTEEVAYKIKNLAFKPTKRVIIEEMTGMSCGNCPRGHQAWDYISNLYGDKVIMAAYHVYTGDPYARGMNSYVSEILNLAGAPSANINRSGVATDPMAVEVKDGKYYYSYSSPDATCWLDAVNSEMETYADADLSISGVYNTETGKTVVPFAAKFALDLEKQNIGMFLIITEDDLIGYQDNYHANWDPAQYIGLEDWCKGGKYGQETVYPFTQNHVASHHVGSYYGATGYLPANITNGQSYTGTIEFTTPTVVTDIANCNVICMMIDANTGKLINVAEAELVSTTGIDETISDVAGDKESARYNAAGQAITAPQKGVNIVRYSNGVVRKTIVK